MWNDLLKHLPDFTSAVLTFVDAEGYPFSLRCQPQTDTPNRILRLKLPEYVNIQPGRAGLLCHRHDERLWNLKSFIVRGSLERDPQGWLFRPRQFTPGAGIGGMVAMVKFMLEGRRTAQRYLERRGMKPPAIPWEKIDALWAEVKREQG